MSSYRSCGCLIIVIGLISLIGSFYGFAHKLVLAISESTNLPVFLISFLVIIIGACVWYLEYSGHRDYIYGDRVNHRESKVTLEQGARNKEATSYDEQYLWYCSFCNFENPSDVHFCKNCGKYITLVRASEKKMSFLNKYLRRFLP